MFTVVSAWAAILRITHLPLIHDHRPCEKRRRPTSRVKLCQFAGAAAVGRCHALRNLPIIVHMRLRAWAELAMARRQFESGNASGLTNLANPFWSRSDGVTPTGLPAALLAATYVEGFSATERARFVPLLHATLDGLRAGRWLFSFEERRFYDEELRRPLELAGTQPPGEDSRLAEWASIESLARRVRPSANGRHHIPRRDRPTTSRIGRLTASIPGHDGRQRSAQVADAARPVSRVGAGQRLADAFR
jgi:hypothetical protein